MWGRRLAHWLRIVSWLWSSGFVRRRLSLVGSEGQSSWVFSFWFVFQVQVRLDFSFGIGWFGFNQAGLCDFSHVDFGSVGGTRIMWRVYAVRTWYVTAILWCFGGATVLLGCLSEDVTFEMKLPLLGEHSDVPLRDDTAFNKAAFSDDLALLPSFVLGLAWLSTLEAFEMFAESRVPMRDLPLSFDTTESELCPYGCETMNDFTDNLITSAGGFFWLTLLSADSVERALGFSSRLDCLSWGKLRAIPES